MVFRRVLVACVATVFPQLAFATSCPTSPLECVDANEPLCDLTKKICIPGPSNCIADDAADQGGGDDGPAAATVLTLPAEVSRSMCSDPFETDVFTFELIQPQRTVVGTTTESKSGNVFATVFNSQLIQITTLASSESPQTSLLWGELPAGRYYVFVQGGSSVVEPAAPYTLQIHADGCASSVECVDPARPMCVARQCVSGPAACVGDDARETGGDDGPAGALVLADGVSATAAVCSMPAVERFATARAGDFGFNFWERGESDWYAIDVSAGEGLIVELAFAGAEDLDLVMFDAGGDYVGRSHYVNPERVTLTYLPAGRYYARVARAAHHFAPPDTAAKPYTITATHTPAQTCGSSADCAAEHATQYFRGDCTAGVCSFLPTASFGACDSGGNTPRCSYRSFQANADESRAGAECEGDCNEGSYCLGYRDGSWCGGLGPCPPTPGRCVLKCTCDAECGVDISISPVGGATWEYGRCLDNGVCAPDSGVPECTAPSSDDGGCAAGGEGGPFVMLLAWMVISSSRRRGRA